MLIDVQKLDAVIAVSKDPEPRRERGRSRLTPHTLRSGSASSGALRPAGGHQDRYRFVFDPYEIVSPADVRAATRRLAEAVGDVSGYVLGCRSERQT
jgi:hypothetical protein